MPLPNVNLNLFNQQCNLGAFRSTLPTPTVRAAPCADGVRAGSGKTILVPGGSGEDKRA